uniref:Putative reverse transcriptase domain-containing protein n=2 Tax=Tanacetum cinerariifolium TaxID=118510 RepID=A0A6L2LJU7_TANCI|nr:putative reverse transcriptase domain-containing protein [Tanacetum cinerariifolium]
MPPKPDLVFHDAPNVNETAHTAFNVELSPTKPDNDLSHTHRPLAPIIEDWVSDSEDDFEPKTPHNVPSFVQPTKQVKSPRPSVNTVETSIPTANTKIAIPKPESNGNRRNRKACFVCKSLDHLIKDCDFYEKKMAPTSVRSHAHRGNHQKHVVPTAVLTQSKLVPIIAARPVTSVVPKSHVTRPRLAKPIVTKPHSSPRRHINHSPSLKASNFPPKVTAVKGNPQHAMKDNGVIDSGCSRHMTGNMFYLSEFEELNGGYVAFGSNPKGGKIFGKGKIRTGKLDFNDVYFVKELKFNLFSVSQMCDKKNNVLFTDTECLVLSPEFKLPDENQVLLKVPRENNMYNVNLKNIVPSGNLTCLFAKAALDESNLWHRRLGHINFKTMNKLVKGKFDGKVDEEFLVGYFVSSKAFRNTVDDAAFGGKKPEFEGRKPQSEVHVSPSSSAQLKKHNDKTNREAKGKSLVKSLIGYRNLSVEFEDFFDDSINEVNAIDSQVPAVGQISTNNTNTFSAAGPSNAVVLTLPIWKQLSQIEAIRLFLAYASFMGFMVYQMDVKSAFLYGTIEEEVYVCQPPRFKDPDYLDKVYKVVKALYGLHQAPRACSIKYALTVNPNIYVSCIKQFWSSISVKKVNDVTRLQALVDKKRVIITEATIRDALRLAEAEGIDCLPNEEIFTELARMGYEKPSTKLTFYKAFFSSQGKFLIHTILQCMIAKRIPWNEFSFSMALAVICLSTCRKFNFSKIGKGCSGVETPLFEGMLVAQQVDESVAELNDNDVPAAGVADEGAAEVNVDVVPAAVDEPSIPSPTPPTQTPPPSRDIPSTSQVQPTPPLSPQAQPPLPKQPPQPSQDAKMSMDLLHNLVKKLERRNKLKVLKLRRLKKVGTAQRVETSDDTVMDDVSKQGRIIVDMDVDVDVTLKDIAKDVAVDAEIKESLEHEVDEVEPVELQEVVEIVTNAKLITEVVTAASTTITAAAPQLTTAAAPTLTTAPSAARRRKGVVIRDPKETATPSIIIHTEAKSKDKGKGILDEVIDHVQRKEKEDNAVKRYQALKSKPQTKAQARKNMMIYLRNVAGFKMDYFKGMNHDDIRPIFEKKFNSNATPLARKVLVVDYAIYTENNKPYYKIIRADESPQLFLSFLSLLRNFDREDLEVLWELVKEMFASSKPKNFSNDFLLTTLTNMFEKLDVQAQVWKNQRTVHDLAKAKSWRFFRVDATEDFKGKHAKCLRLLVKGLVLPSQDDCVELGSFDIIIGMDWLAKYQAVIVCVEKTVRIPWGNKTLIVWGDERNQGNKTRLNIISCTKTQKYIREGCHIFLTHVTTKETEDKSKKKRLEDILIIRDFPEVFLEDLSSLPSTQQVEFQIDFIPGTAPVARSKYPIHLGSDKMYQDVKKLYWWPNIKATSRPIQSERTIQTFEDMLRAHVIDFGKGWVNHLSLVEFSYNNSYHAGIKAAPFEALYGQKCCSPVCCAEVRKVQLLGPKIVQETTDKIIQIKQRIQTAHDRKKSYAYLKRKSMEFQVGDRVMLKVSPWKDVVHFGIRGKLNPIYIRPFKVLEKVGSIAYKLGQPQEPSRVHNTFHASILKKCCVSSCDSAGHIEAVPAGYDIVPAGHVLVSADRYRIC